jgi:hypothetical protein
VDRLRSLRGPGESYSDAILSLEGQQQAIDLALAQKHCRVTVDVKRVARAQSFSGLSRFGPKE